MCTHVLVASLVSVFALWGDIKSFVLKKKREFKLLIIFVFELEICDVVWLVLYDFLTPRGAPGTHVKRHVWHLCCCLGFELSACAEINVNYDNLLNIMCIYNSHKEINNGEVLMLFNARLKETSVWMFVILRPVYKL
jgi:hypothetical protein